MKSVFRFGAAAAVIAATLVGCDWGGVSSNESWNDAYAWANFSGTYKLVTEVYVDTNNSDGGNEGENSGNPSKQGAPVVGAQNLGYGVTATIKINKEQVLLGLVPGSVSVKVEYREDANTIREFKMDDDGNGNLTTKHFQGDHPSGTITYSSGEIGLTFLSTMYVEKATVTYKSYYDASLGVTGGTSSDGASHSYPITWLNVTQKGNLLTLQDNDGRTYAGKITGASCPDADAAGYVTPGHIRFSFEATCTSNAKYKISGSLSGNWSGAQNETSGTISDRTMDASFSDGGSPIQFQAVSGSVTVVARTVTPVAGAY